MPPRGSRSTPVTETSDTGTGTGTGAVGTGGGGGGGRSNATKSGGGRSGQSRSGGLTAEQQALIASLPPREYPAYHPAEPLDFDNLPTSNLRKYRTRFRLKTPNASSIAATVLGGSVGKKTATYKNESRALQAALNANSEGLSFTANTSNNNLGPEIASTGAALRQQQEQQQQANGVSDQQQQMLPPPVIALSNTTNSPLNPESYHNLPAYNRVPKSELAATAKQHFLTSSSREGDMIIDFIYAVKSQDRYFKVHFPTN